MTFVFTQEGTLKCATDSINSLVVDSTDVLVESDISISPNTIYTLVDGEIVETEFVPDQDVVIVSQWESVRTQRNKLLQETDWIVIKHNESGDLMPEEWKIYRQNLRDITNQDDPFNIIWPSKPQ